MNFKRNFYQFIGQFWIQDMISQRFAHFLVIILFVPFVYSRHS